MTKRDSKLKEIGNIIIDKAREGKLHHSMIVGTGVGKSKIVMDIIIPLKELLHFDRILIAVDNTRLRDFNWEEEFTKWGMKAMFDSMVDMTTYQTAYKWDKSLSNYLIIADEADFALTPEYQKFFRTYQDVNMLAMTGYATESKKELMEELFPCLIEYTQEQAQEDGVLNATPITFVKFDLGKEKTIKVEYDKGNKSFLQSENHAYNYWDTQLGIALGSLNTAEKAALISNDYKEVRKWKAKVTLTASKRAEILLNLDSAVHVTQKIISEILTKTKESKVVIFSKRTVQANKISKYTYHGGNTDALNDKNFHEFNEGKIRELALVDKINRGVNMKNLEYAIFESFFSSDTKMRQRLGRMMRLDPDDLAHIFILLPYFMRKTKDGFVQSPTAAVKWAFSMLNGWDLSGSRIVDWRMIKSEL